MPSIGATTVRMSSRSVISMPRPPKLPVGLDLHLLVHLGIEERRVGIETAQRALDGAVDDVLGLDLVHVLLLDDVDDLGEEPEVLVGRGRVVRFRRHAPAEREREDQQNRRDHHALPHPMNRSHRPLPVLPVLSDASRPRSSSPGAQPAQRVDRLPHVPHLEVEPRAAGRPRPPPCRGSVPAARRPPRTPGSRRRARTACTTRPRDPR